MLDVQKIGEIGRRVLPLRDGLKTCESQPDVISSHRPVMGEYDPLLAGIQTESTRNPALVIKCNVKAAQFSLIELREEYTRRLVVKDRDSDPCVWVQPGLFQQSGTEFARQLGGCFGSRFITGLLQCQLFPGVVTKAEYGDFETGFHPVSPEHAVQVVAFVTYLGWIDLDGAVTQEYRPTHFPLDRSLRVKHAVKPHLDSIALENHVVRAGLG